MLLAVGNGIVRESVLAPLLGHTAALPLSGVLLALIIFFVSWLMVARIERSPAVTWLLIGAAWVMMTLAFEYLFGHYVAGIPWHEIHRVFDIGGGNLFALALLSAALSPWLAARLRGRIS